MFMICDAFTCTVATNGKNAEQCTCNVSWSKLSSHPRFFGAFLGVHFNVGLRVWTTFLSASICRFLRKTLHLQLQEWNLGTKKTYILIQSTFDGVTKIHRPADLVFDGQANCTRCEGFEHSTFQSCPCLIRLCVEKMVCFEFVIAEIVVKRDQNQIPEFVASAWWRKTSHTSLQICRMRPTDCTL